MELCSIEDAFPKVSGFDNSDNKGLEVESKPSKEERRAARKKAKKCKGPALDYVNEQDGVVDPDRPAVKRMGDVPAFVSYNDAFPDLSGIDFEGFSNFGIPKISTNACTTNTEGLPKYFLRTDDDEEGFANYSGLQGDNPGYMINSNIPGFNGTGVEKAGSLPAPETSNEWKPTTSAKAKTAFLSVAPTIESTNATTAKTTGNPPAPSTVTREPAAANDQRDMLMKQINELTKRLEQLEKGKPVQNTQQELLMFVGTGIFLLVSFDIALRASR